MKYCGVEMPWPTNLALQRKCLFGTDPIKCHIIMSSIVFFIENCDAKMIMPIYHKSVSVNIITV